MPFDIVIADDDPVVRHILSSVLRSTGHTVEEYLNGGSLLAALPGRARPADLLFLDLQLGDMTGADVMPEVRKLCGSKTHVIVLSANSKEETEQLFPGLAADSYLAKPFTPAQLLQLLSEIQG